MPASNALTPTWQVGKPKLRTSRMAASGSLPAETMSPSCKRRAGGGRLRLEGQGSGGRASGGKSDETSAGGHGHHLSTIYGTGGGGFKSHRGVPSSNYLDIPEKFTSRTGLH